MADKGALVIVDVQNDFCPGGALAVPYGDGIVPIVNLYIDIFKEEGLPIYATRDYHPEKTVHFKEYGGLWPPHCIKGTAGARLHPDLKLPQDVVIITKGTDPEEDSYSAFQGRDSEGRGFKEALTDAGVKELYVGGLAIDYCVKTTVLDGLKEGFKVYLLVDAVRGVDREEGDSGRAVEEMKKKGALMMNLGEISL